MYLFVLFTAISYPQTGEQDVIYLKNGKSIQGVIKEKIEGKSVIIETSDGIEIIEYSDVKNIEREFFPAINNFYPASGEPGAGVTLNGVFPSRQEKNNKIYVGSEIVVPLQWSANKISIKVPADMSSGVYDITVQIGKQKAIAAGQFKVYEREAEVPQQQMNANRVSQPYGDTYEDLGGAFTMSYSMPGGEFKQTGGGNSGFAKNGFGIGIDGRGRIAENFFIPFGWDMFINSIDLDAMNNSFGGLLTASSDDELYLTLVARMGLGLLLPLSGDVNLYASAEGTFGYYYRPQLTFSGTGSGSTNYEGASAWPFGFSYSAGIMLTNGTTFGYRYYNATPTYTEKYSTSGSIKTYESDREQPTSFGVIFVGIGL